MQVDQEHNNLVRRGYRQESVGNLGWTRYYCRDRDGSEAIMEIGPLPHQVKSLKVTRVKPTIK